ncbi:uncharacterized protein LOC120003984 [Tripterygium wilfordii]|uniref:uncharacterized protein LOC120003984 n=1 Tax=Tripterygium wilfordii TaxID=458696 RepID=UPI0018F80BC4|nr:uncharacterized protein LOC120003984 [Tripterygium wilfordii]
MDRFLLTDRPRLGFCSRAKNEKILQVVRRDGKALEFNRPVLVKEILVNFPGAGIGLSEEAKEQLPPDYELKVGDVYHVIPCSSASASAVKRIKMVITKQQLQLLLTKQVSLEQVLDKGNFDYATSWKPKLESIPEGCVWS